MTYPGGFQFIMLDVLEPRKKHTFLYRHFVGVKYDEKGEPDIDETGLMVPDYQCAIDYFLECKPATRETNAFKNAPAYEKVQTAYTYIWDNFQREVNEIASEHDLIGLSVIFDDFVTDAERYKLFKSWLLNEREQILKKPADDNDRIEFFKWTNNIHHLTTLFTCLHCVCIIIDEGEKLIKKALSKYSPAMNTEVPHQFVTVPDNTKLPTLTPPPAPASDRTTAPTIYILPDARPSLMSELLPYVDPSQHGSLEDLINKGLGPEKPIICQCEQVKIGAIFYHRVSAQFQRDRQIQGDKTKLAKWICLYFNRGDNGEVKNLSESTILNYLSGKGFAQYQ